MNKVIAAVGVAALSAASVQAQYAPGLTPLETAKPWTLAASLRGFYDDNYLTVPNSFPKSAFGGGTGIGHAVSSWGTEVIPTASINHSAENTLVSGIYIFDLQWYENKSVTDMSHVFIGRLDHEFSERYKLSISESFAIAQEPTVIDTAIITVPERVNGNNVRNAGQIDFTDSLTQNLDLHLGYGNTLYAYQETARSVIGYGENFFGDPYLPNPSRSALSDRMEQLASIDLRWKITPETTGVLGYQFGLTEYTSPEYIIFPVPPYNGPVGFVPPVAGSTGYYSDIRNSDSHYGFVGVDKSFTPTFSGSIRAGGEYLDYYKYHTSRFSPYVDASVTDQYLANDSAQLGVRHVHNPTDVVGYFGTTPVLDEETTVAYLTDNHRFSDHFEMTLMGQAQFSTLVGGGSGFNAENDDFYVVQLNFAYHFNPWLATEAGYNYSRLVSNLAYRGYSRDVVYLGFRGTY